MRSNHVSKRQSYLCYFKYTIIISFLDDLERCDVFLWISTPSTFSFFYSPAIIVFKVRSQWHSLLHTQSGPSTIARYQRNNVRRSRKGQYSESRWPNLSNDLNSPETPKVHKRRVRVLVNWTHQFTWTTETGRTELSWFTYYKLYNASAVCISVPQVNYKLSGPVSLQRP